MVTEEFTLVNKAHMKGLLPVIYVATHFQTIDSYTTINVVKLPKVRTCQAIKYIIIK